MNATLLALISATGTLVGVLVGGWLTSRNQKRERQIRFFREQLGEFYGPMLAMRAEVLAKAELRLKISGAAGAAWQELIGNARRGGAVEQIQELREASFPMFEEIVKYNNRQFAEEIMPSYRMMVRRFAEKMHFAEVSTVGYLEELIDFVEIWNRWLAESLPSEVVARLGHSEKKLYPFYRDVASHFVALQAEVKEARRWWRRWKRSEPIKVVPSR
jgi:hypothetical protein